MVGIKQIFPVGGIAYGGISDKASYVMVQVHGNWASPDKGGATALLIARSGTYVAHDALYI